MKTSFSGTKLSVIPVINIAQSDALLWHSGGVGYPNCIFNENLDMQIVFPRALRRRQTYVLLFE